MCFLLGCVRTQLYGKKSPFVFTWVILYGSVCLSNTIGETVVGAAQKRLSKYSSRQSRVMCTQ